jgi:hypothetical protein
MNASGRIKTIFASQDLPIDEFNELVTTTFSDIDFSGGFDIKRSYNKTLASHQEGTH